MGVSGLKLFMYRHTHTHTVFCPFIFYHVHIFLPHSDLETTILDPDEPLVGLYVLVVVH